ncbi:putative bifunctional diguanylate cyclase/phosphodiesterase [Sphaerotilus sp.]|uniref:putative bifunctional diguanylate cyclase/phosphodiesterase n=1 Tax=Sphaerotilus sp. TaxID=2093942 RepID=UPI0025D3C8A5|nr:EAL domain-containing protein [Sphaerotilus sp.]
MRTLPDADEARLLEALHQPVWIFDIDHSRVHWANAAGLHLWQARSLAELSAREMGADMSESVARRLRQYQQDFERGDARFSEQWTLYPGGRATTLWVGFSGVRLTDGRMAMLCEARPHEAMPPDSLRSVEALLHTEVMTTLYSRAGRALYRNPAARASVPAGNETLQQRLLDRQDLRELVRGLVERGHHKRIARVLTTDGERWHDVSARLCRDAVTGRQALLVSETDISGLKQAQAQAQYLADHDLLTGLPNRNHVIKCYPQALEDCRRQGLQAALVFLDLDHFKRVNDSLGHAVGDELLMHLARRLRGALGPQDRVARLGGDEFLLLLPHADAALVARQRAQELVTLISQPVLISQTELRVTPSIGLSLFPQDGQDIDTLMRHADQAMYSAKAAGRNGMAWFQPAMNAAAQSRLDLEVELRRALAHGDIRAWFQPRVSVETGKIVGAEALARWHHPQRGMIPPDVFIPVCEDCGLICELGAVVLEASARQQVAWAQQGWVLDISVNLSPRQFFYNALLQDVRDILDRTGCDPRHIELEITESVLLGHDGRTVATLEGLSAMGLGIAIDDFGTGYSNLAYLHRYPVDTLKIDRSFVRALDDLPALTEMIVTMCQVLKVNMVAEGVETAEQLAWLQARGVHEYQGFLFSPAVPPEAFERLLRAGSPQPQPQPQQLALAQ